MNKVIIFEYINGEFDLFSSEDGVESSIKYWLRKREWRLNQIENIYVSNGKDYMQLVQNEINEIQEIKDREIEKEQREQYERLKKKFESNA